nr:type II secretion system protein [uncultured Oscillibacter sp.]
MSKHIDNKRNSGFTMVEALAAVAILVILLGLSAVGVSYYRDLLKITELDNAARAIYMAAEDRAVLLESGGQLEDILVGASPLAGGTGGVPSQVVKGKDDVVALDLLTAGAVDPALLEGEFYIVYDPAGAAVTDVFYTEGPGIQDIGYAFSIAGDRDKRMRPDSGPMLGYYGGEHAPRQDYSPLPAPEVLVVIHNEERLTVDVTFTVPKAARDLMGAGLEQGTARKVTLDYQGTKIVLLDTAAPVQSPFSDRMERPLGTGSLSGGSIRYTWVLDALEDGRHFHELFGGSGIAGFGGDFTVEAGIELSADGRRSASASGSDTDNSLFAEHSGGDTARLEVLRHLQNLDTGTSMAGGKRAAVQLADIHCCDNDTYPDYAFVPIENEELTSFDGGWDIGHERNWILDLQVTGASAAGKGGAGLFASAKDKMTFTGVRLTGAEVEAGGALQPAGALIGRAQKGLEAEDVWIVNASVRSGSAPAGGVAGTAGGVSLLQGCRVYWEPEAGREDLRSLLGSDEDGYRYQIRGTHAGGLVGHVVSTGGATGNTTKITVEDSLAASMIQGAGSAGGLIGEAQSVPVTIGGSYADCYISGRRAAGLIGNATNQIKLTGCYAAGFIDLDAADGAAGLCQGSAPLVIEGAYSAMSYPGHPAAGKVEWIGGAKNDSSFTDTYYLGEGSVFSDGSSTWAYGRSYDEMSAPDFAAELGGVSFAFKGYKTAVDSRNTYPYNLQEKQNLTAYSFPGLKGLPHHGDWQAYFKEPSLVYYEEYEDGTRGFSGGNARHLIGQLDGKVITSDGYAVALLRSDLDDASPKVSAFRVVYTYLGEGPDGRAVRETMTVEYETDRLLKADWEREEGGAKIKEEYYLAPLPEGLVTGDRTTKDFYQYLRFEIDQSLTSTSLERPSGEFFYCPHFAETVKPYSPVDGHPLVDWTQGSADAEGPGRIDAYMQTLSPKGGTVSVRVRAPRHLYDLSLYRDYYNNDQRVLAFRQELDLDYQDYMGHGFADLPKEGGSTLQAPIGTQAAPFRGSYDGGCRSIEHVVFTLTDSARVCMGLFGCSNGNLSNIVYRLDPQTTFSRVFQGKQAYFGTLAGINGGTISNCAVDGVDFSVSAYDSELYIGGLVGVNEHTISNCAAELASLAVDASRHLPAYAGGLAGRNNADILRSYAVGRLSAKAEESSTPISLCGFVCRDHGRIRDSYSAMDLIADGAGASAHGFCDPAYGAGRQSGTAYLNRGNFTYRDAYFLADYDPAVNGAAPLTYQQLTEGDPVSGMSKCTAEGAFPYPTGVTDGAGRPVHYGLWPEPMDLGDMGVYYWEELVLDGRSTYHISLLAVDPGTGEGAQKTISKPFTLSTAYNSGGEVRRYGYGFYNETGHGVKPVDAGTKDLYYSSDGGKGSLFTKKLYEQLEKKKKEDPEDPDRKVDEELADLMKGFEFHSFHSFALDREEGGLYPGCSGKSPNATLTLEQGDALRVTFYLDPHFADALAVQKPAGTWETKDGVVFADSDPGFQPGQAKNPYEVRSIAQLQLINWNKENRDTSTVITCAENWTPSNISQFPYLSSGNGTGDYDWVQTFDILGERDEDGEYKTYSPIAEYYDHLAGDANNGTGTICGWFSGNYDGGYYLIENVNIQGHARSSCTGLFGVVYDGSLENIILYSSDGKGKISTLTNSREGRKDPESRSRWFCMGALAGVAGTSDQKGNAISNCSVAGYTIDAQTYTYNGGWGGNNIGGMVGASCMNFSNCSSVVDIEVDNAVENDNMRVGGLAGICQGDLTNCYAGGSISIGTVEIERPNERGIYVGGLVGGSYMKPLTVAGTGRTIGAQGDQNKEKDQTNNTLTNCYSYVRLPAADAHKNIDSLYALGGTGELYPAGKTPAGETVLANHGTCKITNCYYLTGEVMASNGGTIEAYRAAVKKQGAKTDLDSDYGSPVGLSYEQLSGAAPIEGQRKIYQLINDERGLSDEEAREAGPFHPVSNTAIGTDISVPGKYSYPPDTSPALKDQDYSSALRGMDYPFPTILQRDVAGEGTYHVHYGRWPLSGFSRMSLDGKTYLGGTPILIDLFGGSAYQERLVLKGVSPGGDWSASSIGDTGTAAFRIDPDGASGTEYILTVTGVSEGTAPLTLTYTTADGIPYTILVSVHVNVGIRLRPAKVFLFPDDTVTVRMTPVNSAGGPLKDKDGQDIQGVLELTDPSSPIHYLSAQAVQPDGGSARDALRLTTSGAPQEATAVSAEFTYTIDPGDPDGGKAYKDFSPVQVQILPLPAAVFTKETVTGEDGGTKEQDVCTLTFDDLALTEGGDGDVLRCRIVDVRLADDPAGPDGVRIDWSRDGDGTPDGDWIKLTYPEDGIPEVRLAVTLAMTGGDGTLIPAGEDQIHELALSVSAPQEGGPEGRAMALPEALPPAEGAPDVRTRRRRGRDRRS